MTNHLTSMVKTGLEVTTCSDIPFVIENLSDDGFDFAIIPLVHPRLKLYHIDVDRSTVFFIPQLVLEKVANICYGWPKYLMCKIECSLKEFESNDSTRRQRCKNIFIQELSYCLYLGFHYVLLTVDCPNFINFARELYVFAMKKIDVIFYVKMSADVGNINTFRQNLEGNKSHENTWEWWNTFRTIVPLKNVQLAIEITENINTNQLYKWLGEPLRSIFISTHIFKTNKAGFPFLDRALRAFVKEAIHKNIHIVIKGACRHLKYLTYVQYLQYLKQTTPHCVIQNLSNYLSSDLKPRNNLYKDKKSDKYLKYQTALYNALIDKVSEEKAQSAITTICILGESMIPLIELSSAAANEAKRKIKLIVIAKEKKIFNKWTNIKHSDNVTVMFEDINWFNGSIKVDIMLLGFSDIFADTVLSPEMLFSVQQYIKVDGICIPYRYTSYLVPITSQTLHNKVRTLDTDPDLYRLLYEQPYHAYEQKLLEVSSSQKLFSFSYPCKRTDIVRVLNKKLEYSVDQNCSVHGLMGYFDLCLYKDINLTICLKSLTPEFIHWFPIYFPIKTPLQLKKDSKMEVHFWRKHDGEKIWYEWLISKPVSSYIHNTNASSHWINFGENNTLFSLYKRNYKDLISW